MIFDSDVLIWLLRGHAKAIDVVDRNRDRKISIISGMELFRGARDKEEMARIRRLLLRFEILPLSEDIGYRACLYMEQLALRVSLDSADTLIAATAVAHRQPLCTGNVKHFRQISGLTLNAFRP